jgi:DNA invertase Pin-like site-specific DNA recombinase
LIVLVEMVAEMPLLEHPGEKLLDGLPAGRFFFHVMASLAQMERELLVERTRA